MYDGRFAAAKATGESERWITISLIRHLTVTRIRQNHPRLPGAIQFSLDPEYQ
jgi:hypothetical protein